MTPKRDKVTDQVAKDLLFTEMNLGKYLTKHFALWLDLRTTDDNSLHGSGRAVLNASEGITIQITKTRNRGNFKYLSIFNFFLLLVQDINMNTGKKVLVKIVILHHFLMFYSTVTPLIKIIRFV